MQRSKPCTTVYLPTVTDRLHQAALDQHRRLTGQYYVTPAEKRRILRLYRRIFRAEVMQRFQQQREGTFCYYILHRRAGRSPEAAIALDRILRSRGFSERDIETLRGSLWVQMMRFCEEVWLEYEQQEGLLTFN